MKIYRKWLSGFIAAASGLLLLTGCGGDNYGYSDGPAAVWEGTGQEQQSAGAEGTGREQQSAVAEGMGREQQSAVAEGTSREQQSAVAEGTSREQQSAGAEGTSREQQSAVAEGTGREQRSAVAEGTGQGSPQSFGAEEGDPPGDGEAASGETDALWGDTKPSGEYQNDPAGVGAHLDEYGSYTLAEDVALYLYIYEELPDNFITKKEAQALGWEGGSLEPYAPGMCIGGDYFGNYEGNLPEEEGREYHECDIDTLGAGSRGAKRIVYSNDGLIYYTEDHYETFTLLYGEE